jgi:hypothetical protein
LNARNVKKVRIGRAHQSCGPARPYRFYRACRHVPFIFSDLAGERAASRRAPFWQYARGLAPSRRYLSIAFKGSLSYRTARWLKRSAVGGSSFRTDTLVDLNQTKPAFREERDATELDPNRMVCVRGLVGSFR